MPSFNIYKPPWINALGQGATVNPFEEIPIAPIVDVKKHPKIYKIHIDSLHWKKVQFLQSLCPYQFLEYGWVIAGGCLRSLFEDKPKIKDVDIYQLQHNKNKSDENWYDLICKTTNQKFVKQSSRIAEVQWNSRLLQIIEPRHTFNIPDLLRGFDFHTVCFAFDGEYFYFTRQAIRDCRRKKITLQNPRNPFSTFRRMMRYSADYSYQVDDAMKSMIKHLKPDLKLHDQDYFV